MASSYEVPSWAGKPPPGIHLDISKDQKFIQKIMIDEKKVKFDKVNAWDHFSMKVFSS